MRSSVLKKNQVVTLTARTEDNELTIEIVGVLGNQAGRPVKHIDGVVVEPNKLNNIWRGGSARSSEVGTSCFFSLI